MDEELNTIPSHIGHNTTIIQLTLCHIICYAKVSYMMQQCGVKHSTLCSLYMFIVTSTHCMQYTEPFVVSFERTLYEVAETGGQVEICVILTRPDTDIFENVVGVEVFEDDVIKTNEFIPIGAAIASETYCIHLNISCHICMCLTLVKVKSVLHNCRYVHMSIGVTPV